MVELSEFAEAFKIGFWQGRNLFSCLFHQNRYLTELNQEVEKLKDLRERIVAMSDNAARKGERTRNDVERWLGRVEECLKRAEYLNRARDETRCSELVSRSRIYKEAVKELKAVVRLKEEGNFESVSYGIVQRDIWSRDFNDYETFESRMSIFNDIYNALCSDNINIIGVYGMGGIGKTTLVKQVARRAMEEKKFDEVVMATVSLTPNIRRIQGDLADQLGVIFQEENEAGRGRRLRERLNQRNGILLILDDIWERLGDLEEVGIPLSYDHGVCKVLLTSRIHDVPSKMGSQRDFLVGVLKEEEAYSLFMKIVDDPIENLDLQSLTIEVVRACGGLPIAIVSIARALRRKHVSAWKDALWNLRNPSSRKSTRMLEEVFSSIELSYQHLQDEELKSTFLLCSLIRYSDDVPILDLLKYGTGLGLYRGISTLEQTRDKVYSLVHELKSSSLLLDGRNSEWFSIHAVVHHVALSIASRGQHVFSLRNEVTPRDWLLRDSVTSCNAISIHDSNIIVLPERLEYPELEFFYMRAKNAIFKIPDSFFTGMTKLSALNLKKMDLSTLSSSLPPLINLKTLCLDECKLGGIAGIGDLKKLEILSLLCLDIEQLPKEIGKLTKLRLLDLSDCSKLKVISPSVISSLTGLEELYMGNSFAEWELEGINTETSNASLEELKHLSRLTSLEIHIRHARNPPVGLFPEMMKRYKIFIGDEWDWHNKYEYKRSLKLKLNPNTRLENEIIMQMNETEELCLDGGQGVKNVLNDLDAGGFPKLKLLNIQNNPHILRMVNSVQPLPCDAFPLLESLFLRNLMNLEKICHGELTATSFFNLRTIKVRNCDKLRNILSISTLRGLPKLQTLELINCMNMEEIVTIGREGDVNYAEVIDTIDFRQLRFLTLKFLPRLTSFCCQVMSHSTNRIILEDVLDQSLPLFTRRQVMFHNLEALELCAINCEKIWPDQLPRPSGFQNLTSMIVRGCDKLKFLFSSSLVTSFVQIRHLEICNCMALEHIVTKEDEIEATPAFIFPQVTYLKLCDLPELRTFYPGRHTSEWPFLKRLELSGCDKVNIFASESFSFEEIDEAGVIVPAQQALFKVEKVVTNLEELRLSGKDLTMIREDHFPDNFFQKLKILAVMNDESEDFQLGFLQMFRKLEKIELRLSLYREIFSFGEVVRFAGMLRCIQNLKLWKLLHLKYLWKQESEMDSILQNLEVLEVWWCDALINLVPSSVSFQNLKILELWYCRGLKSLLAPSTAKSLVQLLKLSIDGCEMMTEIITSEVDVAENEIVFRKLTCLSLENLQSLTSFCSGDYTLKFPSLEDLFVTECPKMKIFSPGVVSAPRLQEVRQNEEQDEGYWKDDVNTTIQWLHKEKGGSC
ncbi:probable disease resistance protein At4g27220 isoform X1 [Mangifera indica]|uniref:probable disease resistance protein At4g27220 isoform X1 n=1 Tax=Mangifera indica TaxID=29780 RepID=UPI001CFAA4CD|nr:probable disease resistance protein At4g27220 isoform X1 [Mangifera indica]XP_044498594.1 probable disease resistance protein At4g27220 isoform X1 [Mangifera indica]XP_044498595.1 probable disease resistance protein At4g27220 isoform X1 [Mangifera indica]